MGIYLYFYAKYARKSNAKDYKCKTQEVYNYMISSQNWGEHVIKIIILKWGLINIAHIGLNPD